MPIQRLFAASASIMVCASLALLGYGALSSAIAAGPPQSPNPTVAPTDLSGVTPNWDKNLPSASRFTVLAAFDNQAVRDNNTGLVWSQFAGGTANGFADARFSCLRRNIANTKGWRLPSVIELSSLQDPSLPPPFVPTSVFTVTPGVYWSGTTSIEDDTRAWIADFQTSPEVSSNSKSIDFYRVWCVRGPMQESVY